MDVIIIENETGKVVCTHTIFQIGLNYASSEREYFDSAWKCAVADNDVDVASRANYSIKFKDAD